MSRLSFAAATLCLGSGLVPTAPVSRTSPASGVVVEKVGQNSAAEKAGLRAGDILLSWTREPSPPSNPTSAQGSLQSTFDFSELQAEQQPRGRVTLKVERGDRRFSVAIPPGEWKLTVCPLLSAPDAARRSEAQALLAANESTKASVLLRDLATALSQRGDHRTAASLFLEAGAAAQGAKQWDESQTLYDLALAEATSAGDAVAAAETWEKKAYGLRDREDRNEQDRARDALRRALQIRAIHNPQGPSLAAALSRLSDSLRRKDPKEADALAQRSIRLSRESAPASLTLANCLTTYSFQLINRGEYDQAEALLLEAKGILDSQAPESTLASATLTRLAVVLANRGDLEAADALLRQSLAIDEKVAPNRVGGDVLNLGYQTASRGELDVADGLFRRAAILDPSPFVLMKSLNGRAWVAFQRADYQGAEAFYTEALSRALLIDPQSQGAAESLRGLGDIAAVRGDAATALDFYARALPLDELTGRTTVAMALNRLGEIYLQKRDPNRARLSFQSAMETFRLILPGSTDLADSAHGLGLAYRDLSKLPDAERSLCEAVEILESQPSRLREYDAAAAAKRAAYYRDYIQVLIELGKVPQSLGVLERSRAHEMLTLLGERELVFTVDLPQALDLERRQLDREYDQFQDEFKARNPMSSAEVREQLAGRLRDLQDRRSNLAERLKKASPRYAALQYPQPLDLAGTKAALDPGTLLLSYTIGKEKSFLFAVSLERKRGPPLSVYTLPVGEKTLRESIKAFRKLIEWGESSQELSTRARSLYDTLLRPAEALVSRSERLLILPDGPLHTLPWAALAGRVESGRPRYLVEWKPIHTAISATVYAQLKRERHPPAAPAVDVAAFGDPKYPKMPGKKIVVRGGETEETSASESASEEEAVDDAQVRSVLRGGFRFDPLPATRQEVEQIVRLYSPKATAYLGEDATEEKARSIGKDVPLIHYACHAVVNERFPLDSALVFTIPEHPKEGQDNGLLQAWEIFEKVRIDADLVTLSACESGLGKEMGGEGLIGLTRAFQYAGARSVLASLWKVEDKATGELMKRFYTYLKAGKTKDEALRSAQIDLIHSADLSQPKDWAAFQLNGDWK